MDAVRSAEIVDKNLFLELWEQFAADVSYPGYGLLWTERTRTFFAFLFDAYVSGELDGVCLVMGDYGVTLYGSCSEKPQFDTPLGRVAYAWGTYIKPEMRGNGCYETFLDTSVPMLRAMGFDSLLADSPREYEPVFGSLIRHGFTEYSAVTVLRLKEI